MFRGIEIQREIKVFKQKIRPRSGIERHTQKNKLLQTYPSAAVVQPGWGLLLNNQERERGRERERENQVV